MNEGDSLVINIFSCRSSFKPGDAAEMNTPGDRRLEAALLDIIIKGREMWCGFLPQSHGGSALQVQQIKQWKPAGISIVAAGPDPRSLRETDTLLNLTE